MSSATEGSQRDIEPTNIMVERLWDGRLHPVVMDFGLAYETSRAHGLTQSGVVMGTPAYMPPEQARGQSRHIDRRADVYSLGATFYELLTGTPPFKSLEVIRVLMAILEEDPPPIRTEHPEIPADLETIVLKCLAKEPGQRYDSARALAEDLQRFLDGDPVLARPLGWAQRLSRRARKHKLLLSVAAALLVSLMALAGFGIRARLTILKRERQAREQAALAERLGQEITDMEWLLRSARQLPLHDLRHEKEIIRQRIAQLQTRLQSYGEGRSLAHYALGRGHMALHEYPQALAYLRQALTEGHDGAEAHYALGFVLGKQFEQAILAARLSGRGRRAKQQIKESEPRFLAPAIAELQRSKQLSYAAATYLDGLLAFYERDYDAALRYADAALDSAPWQYEAAKLAGDVYLEKALRARDSGAIADARAAFAASVQRYEQAARVGQSDAEVYEGLAETWVRQIEMAVALDEPAEAAYEAAVAASDKILIADPENSSGLVKKAYAAVMTMDLRAGASQSRVQQCFSSVQAVLERQPSHPYASEAMASCYTSAAAIEKREGGDPEPSLRKGMSILEPVLQQHPQFLWGLNDMAILYSMLADHEQAHGNPAAADTRAQAAVYYERAIAVDATFIKPYIHLIELNAGALADCKSLPQVAAIVDKTRALIERCLALNDKHLGCYSSAAEFHARAARRTFTAGADPQPLLSAARLSLGTWQSLAPDQTAVAQTRALVALVDAQDRVRRQQDPTPALTEAQAALERCRREQPRNARCLTLSAETAWMRVTGRRPASALPLLLLARTDAEQAAESAAGEPLYTEAWQALAATYLQLAQAGAGTGWRGRQVALGLAAVDKVFAINPSHAPARATQGFLQLLQAELQHAPAAQKSGARAALDTLEEAQKNDPLLAEDLRAPIAQARALLAR
jgi:serine/threonine-protein kinase